ncbi:MAG TPA: DUF6660 family protein [Cytophagaceae bacterium]
MRFLHIILSLYIVFLFILPCTDGAEKDAHITFSQALEGNHEHDHEDTCSPFCVCNCCGPVVLFQFQGVNAEITPLPFTKHNEFYSYKETPSVYLPIWQPPKLNS